MTVFYVLEYSIEGPMVQAAVVKQLSCGICGVRGATRIGSFTVRFSRNDEFADIVRTTEGLIARQSVLNHFTNAQLSGWRQGHLGVEAVSGLRGSDLSYHELIIVGHTKGYADRVGLALKSECKECGRRRYGRPQEGLLMPEECWDGSDVFVIDELPGIRMVTEDFRQVIQRHHHTGIELVPLDEWRNPLGLFDI